MAKKIIFLDIDGVLNNASTKIKMIDIRTGEPFERGFTGIDKINVDVLKTLLEKSGAEIVLSSTWRKDCVREALAGIRYCGLDVKFLDVTPDKNKDLDIQSLEVKLWQVEKRFTERGDEIRMWLDRWKNAGNEEITHFVVLDDSSDMTAVKENFVCTDERYGLREEDLPKIYKILDVKID